MIEWPKIVTNAVSAVVVMVFVGACTIVWRGATSVDSKVNDTKATLQQLITQLSDKLAAYEVQLTKQNEALAGLQTAMAAVQRASTSKVAVALAPMAKPTNWSDSLEVKALSKDIYQQLQQPAQMNK